jgi:DNA-binding transcriptional MocR family regulator
MAMSWDRSTSLSRRAATSAGVIGSTRAVGVFAYTAPVDMRKSYNGLEGLVGNEMGHDLLGGDLPLFTGKGRRPAKVLLSDGTGVCIYIERLSTGQFAKLRCGDGELRMTMSELALFLEGSQPAGTSVLSPARRSLAWGMSLGEDDFVITSGAMEAMHLALRAVTRSGDSVVVSSPTYFGVLQLLEEMSLRVIEEPSHSDRAMDLDALQLVLKRTKPSACVAIPTFDNPNGSLMPHEARARLHALVARHDIPLIEDDIYGDLAWDGSRPSPVKAFDRNGRVLLRGSISKSIAAGYRVGWIAAGRYQARVERLKFSQSVATSTLEQMSVAEYLGSGGYDRHLRTLRGRLASQVKTFREAIAASFPIGTTVSDPRGSFLLWVELPRGVDALQLQAQAARRGIAIAPGPIFAAGNRYKSCIRVNCGSPWSRPIADAVHTLGELASSLGAAR